MITRTTYKARQEWLHARNDTPVIGSSDVGTIMGLNPYMTPYQYWRVKKMETLETAAEEDNDSMIRGRFKEDAIARMFEQVTGEKIVKRSEQIEVYRNDKYPPYMQAAPDREVFAAGRSTRYILECKDTKMHLPELTPETVPMLWYTPRRREASGSCMRYSISTDPNSPISWSTAGIGSKGTFWATKYPRWRQARTLYWHGLCRKPPRGKQMRRYGILSRGCGRSGRR